MGRVYLCLGQNAELPYYFEKAKVHIWNIEELCYFIRENAWIMEPELLTKELIDWVAQQCGLPKLAVLLNDSLKEEDCVTAFAACLFSYTGYCPQEQALQVQKILQTNAGNNETDRAKARGVGGIIKLLEQISEKKRKCEGDDLFPDRSFCHQGRRCSTVHLFSPESNFMFFS